MITTEEKTKATKVKQKKARQGQNLKCTHDIPVEVCGFGCQKMPEYQEYLSQFPLRTMFGADIKRDEDMGFNPGFPPGFDPQRAERGLAQKAKADVGTPFPTEFSQDEINGFAEH